MAAGQSLVILVFEMVWTGTNHAYGNSATIQTIARAVPDQQIRVFADPSHLQELRKDAVLTGCGQVSLHAIKVSSLYAGKTHIVSSRRGARELLTMWRALRTVPRHEPCLIVLISATPTAIFAASLLVRLSRRPIGVHVGLHGNLGDIHGWRPRNPLYRAFDLLSALGVRHPPALRFMVLEDAIRTEMERITPRAAAVTDVLSLPINEAEVSLSQGVTLQTPVRIGLVGQATEAKGITTFLALARTLTARFPGKVTFHVLGRAPPGTDLTRFSDLAEPVTHEHLSREDFQARLARLHYVCLPLQAGYYNLSASGALIDAITWLKPVIATRLPLVEQMFKRFGDLGYLCDDADAMQDAIEAVLVDMDVGHYHRQTEALQRARATRTPDALAREYRSILRDGFGDLLRSEYVTAAPQQQQAGARL